MSQQAIIKRYYLLINLLESKRYPSRQAIIDRFEEDGLICSRRTFTRTLESLRDEFGIEITYSHSQRGYYIDHEKSVNFVSFSNLLNYYNSTENLSQAISLGNNSLQFIQIDSSPTQGLEHLRHIISAINNQKQVKLTYCKFDNEEIQEFEYNPEILKEYQNRWYVIGYAHHRNAIRTYALDRIQTVKMTSNSFTRDLGTANEYFKDVIGVTTSGDEVVEIILSFTHKQGNYIKTLPLHHSQKIITDTLEEFRISINVKPNYELKQRIQMYGNNVKIIHPKGLFE
ncbi:WYL domain-containing transcriptional regulator [Prolixibacteraceae bacterium JC049]|nr:WYL domain-containing transcriptional regulator [Prolixibacteraceae bacterium JC049]